RRTEATRATEFTNSAARLRLNFSVGAASRAAPGRPGAARLAAPTDTLSPHLACSRPAPHAPTLPAGETAPKFLACGVVPASADGPEVPDLRILVLLSLMPNRWPFR